MDTRGLTIVAPVSRPDEVEPLLEEGADELYCGLLPPEWLERFSFSVPLNRRDSGLGNLSSFRSLGDIVSAAHRGGAPVYLTLNAPTYTQGQVEFLRTYCRRAAEEADVDGFLVADPGVMRLLGEWTPDKRIHASSVAAVHNSMAVRFFKDMGVSRIIFPRQITAKEVAAIHHAVPDMELEVFILNDGCVLEEGHCSTTHGAGPFCLTDWEYRFQAVDGRRPLNDTELERLESNQAAYRSWILCHEASGRLTTPTGYPMGPCGLCAIYAFKQAGVNALKVVGRESPTARKLASVRMTRTIRDLAVSGAAESDLAAAAHELRQTFDVCLGSSFCYYPELARTSPTAK